MSTRQKLPDFIIPGAMKSGTSTLVAYLRQHEEVYLPPGSGEIHFFNDRPGKYNYEKGIDWYTNRFSGAKQGQIIGEKTPRYCALYVPKRMYKYLPEIKLVWILRNPVTRAYSHYKMYVMGGIENLSFEEALRNEKVRVNNYHQMFNYKELGQYIKYINEYLKYYTLDKIHFILFENFINNPVDEMNKLSKFLGIKEKQDYQIEYKHKSERPKSIKVQRFIRNLIYGPINGKSLIRPKRIRKPLFNLLTKYNLSKKPFPRMKSKIRSELISYFKSYNRKLQSLIEKDLSIWNK